jgi:hypothetical protein
VKVMKRLAAVAVGGLLVFGLVSHAGASGRHGGYGRYRPEPGVAAVWTAPGFSFSIAYPGTWYPPRRYYRPPRKVWVPGYWKYTSPWVPGRYERLGRHGEDHRRYRWDRQHRHERHDHDRRDRHRHDHRHRRH